MASSYKLLDSSGKAVATIGTSLPTANIRICSKDHVSAAYNYRPFYCYEFAADGKYYYVGMTGIGKGQLGLTLGSDLNRTVSAPYAFSAVNGGIPVSKGETLYLYTIADDSYFTDRTRAIAAGMTVYDASGNAYTVALAYDYTVTVTTAAVNGSQVGNIAICDASGNVLAGSTGKTKSGVSTYSCTISSTAQSVQVKIVATAAVSSYTNEATWHQKFHYAGFTQDSASIADSSIAFTCGVATYTTIISGNSSFTVSYGAKYALTVSNGTGVSSSTLSYSRSHSTGSYVTTSTSPISLSGSGTLYVESGQTVSIAATAADGYVFYTNAITSSSSGYGSISGDGSTSVSGSKVCSGATTFTISGTQFYITPSIVSHNDWGTATINYSSGSQVLKPNTTYTLGFTSSTASTYGAVVDYWSIGGSNYATTFTTGSKITSSITAYLYLRRTKYQLTVAMSAENDGWGSVSGGGWYANGTSVNVVFTPSADYSHLGVSAYQVNYNGETASCGNTATIVTGEGDYQATMYIRQTKFRMSLAYGSSGTDGWGTIVADKEYVGTGDVVRLSFTPTASLVSTIHPAVDHWTLLQQTATPTAYSDGSSSVDVTLGTVSQDFTAICSLVSAYRKVSIQRNDSGAAAWGDFYLGTSGTEKTAYYAPGTQITIRFARATAYDLTERPQVNAIAIGTESSIAGVDGTYSYAYTLPTNTKTDLTITCSVKQTAWPVTVNTDGNGSLTARRMSIADSSVIASVTASGTAQTIYLRSGTAAEYLALTATANAHYGFYGWNKGNLVNYASDAAKVQLASEASASVSCDFTRTDFKVTCATDDPTRADAYTQTDAATEAYYDKTIEQNPVVICKIKASYADGYKVASFSIGTQDGVSPQYNAQGDFYYVEVSVRTDVVVTAHIVRTTFQLTVNVGPDNYAQFGTLVMTSGGEQVKQFDSAASTTYSCYVKEATAIEIVFYQKYGGRVLSIVPSSEIPSSAGDGSISFEMPSADCSVTFTLGEKEKYDLTVGVVNTTEGEAENIPATLTVKSRTYSDIVIGETGTDGVAKTFSVYEDEEYTIAATAVSEYMTRRYTIVGWKDESGDYIEGADSNSINVIGTTTDARTRKIYYALRETGTVTIEYAKKEGGAITLLDGCPDGCSFTLDNTKDKTDETHWLIGADIKMPYTVMGIGYDEDGDAYKWTPVEVDVALATDEYEANATWDDGVLTQTGTFVMRGNMKVRVVFVQTHVPGYTSMKVGFKTGTTKLMGSVSLFATDMDAYTEDHTGARSLVRKQKKAVIMAAPRPGFAFAGWYTLADGVYTAVSGAAAVYEVESVTSPATTYYAEFVASTISNVKAWNGNAAAAKTFEWQSKVYVGAQFFKMQSVRVYSDGYPVTLKLFAASSPDGVFGDSARTVSVTLTGQSPRRLPKMRPEKYFAFRVSGYARINHVGISSSMGGLTA